MRELPVGAPREVFAVVDTHFPDEEPMVTRSPKEAREMMDGGPGLVLVRYVPEADYVRVCLAHAEQDKQTTAMMQAATETINSLRAALAAETGRGEVLDSLAREIGEWQRVTFPTATPSSTAEHLRREAVELAACPSDAAEMADVFFMLVAVSNASGVNLAEAVARKFAVNKARTWGKPDAQGVVEHTTPEASRGE